eukprot:TRINITY_DN7826_c0_g3_i1.p1 TRINITY_DN7826_c0_g3~~TRINITY_DN7826_c0_g3_i1.p1  ORF type:complete len:232 (+),score=35.10 TRINITY_DN7826_c0_g3_i1:65-697(+)
MRDDLQAYIAQLEAETQKRVEEHLLRTSACSRKLELKNFKGRAASSATRWGREDEDEDGAGTLLCACCLSSSLANSSSCCEVCARYRDRGTTAWQEAHDLLEEIMRDAEETFDRILDEMDGYPTPASSGGAIASQVPSRADNKKMMKDILDKVRKDTYKTIDERVDHADIHASRHVVPIRQAPNPIFVLVGGAMSQFMEGFWWGFGKALL